MVWATLDKMREPRYVLPDVSAVCRTSRGPFEGLEQCRAEYHVLIAEGAKTFLLLFGNIQLYDNSLDTGLK